MSSIFGGGGVSLSAANTWTALQTFSLGATFGAAITYGGVTLSNAVTGTGKMVLDTSPTLGGTVSMSTVRITNINNGNNTNSLWRFVDGSANALFSDTAGALMRFAGSTSSFPALSNSGAALVLSLADGTNTVPLYAAGNNILQHGAANAASPVNQTVQAQGSRAGTDTNVGGANLTILPGLGTGTGTPSSLILQSPNTTATGSTAQIAATGLTIFRGSAVVGAGAVTTGAVDGFLYIPTCAGTPTGTPTTNTGRVALVYDTTAHELWIYDGSWLQPKTPAAAAIITWQ